MSSPASEPRNPLYLLLLLASLVFVLTALAVALVPLLEEKATEAGHPPPPSAFRDALRSDGWKWLLYEVALMIVLGLASMVLDSRRPRRLQIATGAGKMPSHAGPPATDPEQPDISPSAPTVSNEQRQGADRGTVPRD